MLLADGPDATPPTYRRAAAFSISRLIAQESKSREEALGILLPRIHQPFLQATELQPRGDIPEPEQLGTADCISTLQNILINTDPSPTLLSTVFTPIASALYAILQCLDSKKTTDPALKEAVKGLLGTWSRIVSAQEVEEVCWSIIEGEGGYWKVDIAGEIARAERYFFDYVQPGRGIDFGVIAGPRKLKISQFLPRKLWERLKRMANLTSTPICLTSDPTPPISSDFLRW